MSARYGESPSTAEKIDPEYSLRAVSRFGSAGVWIAALAAVGFSFKAILVKLAYPYGVDAITLLAVRMSFSLPFFAIMLFLPGGASRAPLGGRDAATLLLLGIFIYLGSLLDFLGLEYISAGLERLILFLYPTLVVVLSALFLRKPIARRAWVALLLSYAGIALAVAHDIGVAADNRNVWLGAVLVFASALSYALYLIGNGQGVERIGAARLTAWSSIVASLACIGQFLLTRPLSALNLPWQVYGLSAAMALFSTVLPVFMISEAIRRIGAGPTSLIGSLGPVATIFLGWLMLDEAVSFFQFGGAALVMTGVLVVSLKPR